MLRRIMFLSGMALLLTSAAALAQDRPQRPQGPGGFGGFGGFLPGNVDLLMTNEIQKELTVSDEQKGLIESAISDLRDQQQQNFRPPAGGGGANFQNMSEEERTKFFEDFRKRMDESSKKADEMLGMILEKKQVERFGELRLQRLGIGAFAGPFARADIVEKLGITKEQKDKMQKIQDDARPDFSAFANFQNMTDEERREAGRKMQEKRDKANEDTQNVLSSDQKEKWTNMQGRKFDFPPPQFGGPGGGRRPGGQGGQPPQPPVT